MEEKDLKSLEERLKETISFEAQYDYQKEFVESEAYSEAAKEVTDFEELEELERYYFEGGWFSENFFTKEETWNAIKSIFLEEHSEEDLETYMQVVNTFKTTTKAYLEGLPDAMVKVPEGVEELLH